MELIFCCVKERDDLMVNIIKEDLDIEEARLEYNSKQSRPSKMIDNYFDNVSNNEKKDLACETILELGDKEYWDTKDENFKKKMSEVYKSKLVNQMYLLKNL